MQKYIKKNYFCKKNFDATILKKYRLLHRMMYKKLKDRDIIAGCKADNPKSQKLLYEKYSRMAMGIALRYTQNLTDAEDVVQDVFIKIFMNIGTLKDEKALATWIHSITTNTCLDFLKKKNPLLNTISLDDPHEEITDNHDINMDISTDQLLRFIQELPDGCRTIFNLYAIDGYKHEEIAQMLGCSNANVRSQYFRARKILREKIESYE